MALGVALGANFLRSGAVLLAHRFKFPDQTQPKYCVLLEPYDGSRPTTIFALTTSNPQYKHLPYFVDIPDGVAGIEGISYLDCSNCWERPTLELTSRKYRYIGQLPDELLEEVYLALEEATDLPEYFLVRIFGE